MIGLVSALAWCADAQTLHTDSLARPDSAKTLVVRPFRRPIAVDAGASTHLTNEAVRYYGSPQTIPSLLENAGIGAALLLGDQGYGREVNLFTSRTSEPLTAGFINGILPLNDPISGNSMLNYYPIELLSALNISHGGAMGSLDHAASDVVDGHIETFRTPIAYSRMHYTQELGHSFSNFEGLLAVSPSEPLNIALAVYRRGSGSALNSTTLNLNPRTDDWWVRSQASYDSKNIHALLFALYTSAFSGTNGGTFKIDSTTDVFDEQLAPTYSPRSYDHRTRLDLLGQSAFSLLSEKDPTLIAAYMTISARKLFVADSTFSSIAAPLRNGDRFGMTFQQPAELSLGAFTTRALLRADAQVLSRTTPSNRTTDILEKRYSALASDSLSLGGAFGVSANGFFRWTLSSLTLGGNTEPDLALSNFGLEGSARLSRALSVTAQFTYMRDRAVQSPDPLATYELRNLGIFTTLGIPFGVNDSIAITTGYLDRVEPEGIILVPTSYNDSLYYPAFSATALHSRGINGSINAWLGSFRINASGTFLPSVHPLSSYTNIPSLVSDISARISAQAGVYYESDIADGNLRLSLGGRTRYLNRLTPALSYDAATDYYAYRGLPHYGTTLTDDSRFTSPRYIVDILASALIDQRAQVNVQFLNVLGTPYFNVPIYPREGFSFRLDVTWAFLD
ncbi:MAG: hypothetical protein JSS75_03925 [Bacteroidetes bacterium]|nr:hypothetical protein [Bacteroidota bacterium]